jgi:ABC-type multidrug transport system ATPase subunit
MSASAIEFQGIQKSFGLAFSLGPLTLSVPRGSIYALIGPNGAGKSTALNMLMGMGEPTLGSIQVLDRGISSVFRRRDFWRPIKFAGRFSLCAACR